MATLNELMVVDPKIKSAVDHIVKGNTYRLKYKKEKAEGQAVIIPVMKREGIGSEKVNGLNFTYTAPTKRDKFDQKKAKELLLDWGFDSEVIDLIWDEASKESDVAECLKIT